MKGGERAHAASALVFSLLAILVSLMLWNRLSTLPPTPSVHRPQKRYLVLKVSQTATVKSDLCICVDTRPCTSVCS